jgi:hypothetical protein
VITRAALCPSPPLLAAAVTGQEVLLPDLREACAAAVAWLLATAPDAVAVIGPATVTKTWAPVGVPDLAMHAPAAYPGPSTLPLSLVIGAQLLDAAGYPGRRILQSVAESASSDACAEVGRELATAVPRVALLVMGDGSARRSAAAPGYLDDRAEPFDLAVEQAFRDGDLPALTALDADLARDLLAAGRPAWQALAGALSSAPQSEILYSAAPFGVAYLVATLAPAA